MRVVGVEQGSNQGHLTKKARPLFRHSCEKGEVVRPVRRALIHHAVHVRVHNRGHLRGLPCEGG